MYSRLDKIQLEIGIPLLVARHMGIPQVIVVNVIESEGERIRIPFVYEARSSLERLRFFAGKCHEMDADLIEIMHGETCQGFSVGTVYDIASHRVRTMFAHAEVVFDVILLE